MLQYEIANAIKARIDERLIKQCVQAFGQSAQIKKKKIFSLAFVDAKMIRKFNRNYRGKDKATDVLSFAQRDSDFSGPGEEAELGEILICYSQVKKQAKENGWPVDYEICRLLIHGLAHLIGYEHEGVSKKEEEKMIKFEAGVISKIPLPSRPKSRLLSGRSGEICK